MLFTDGALALLKRLEGCRLQAYRDQAGVWTIGYGHTGREVVAGLQWTQAQADAALGSDLVFRVDGVSRLLGAVILNDNQFSALVIFAFNVGLIALGGSTALREIKNGNMDAVPRALGLWCKIHDSSGVPIVNVGLANRRSAEIVLWNTPVGTT